MKETIMTNELSSWARTIAEQKKYIHDKGMDENNKESWNEVGYRVASNVLKSVNADEDLIKAVADAIANREFMPGGRYFHGSGRPYHQTQNCFVLFAEDSREGWSDLMYKSAMALMSGGGIGIDYSSIRPEGALIRKTGGVATGPIALMKIINEAGRNIMSGGSRRSAIFASLSWKHADIIKFITTKNWSDEVMALKAKDFNFPATLDMTNISVGLDDEFFAAWHDTEHVLHSHARMVFSLVIEQMCKTGEPGFSINVGKNAKETGRNAPVTGKTIVMTDKGLRPVIDLVGRPCTLWTGDNWAKNVIFEKTRENSDIVRVTLSNGKFIECAPDHEFVTITAGKEKKIPAEKLKYGTQIKSTLPEHDLGRHFYITGVIDCEHKEDVYCCDVKLPEHSFWAEGVIISNCTEFTSEDDSDVCNLGSINMARVKDLDHFRHLVEIGSAFLLAGTVYSDVPYAKVDQVRTKNRKIGLGLMGIHEWLLKKGYKYGFNDELRAFMEVYKESDRYAGIYADKWSLNRPLKTRAIAPTGTISIVAETTSGIEPIFCAAYKRRYLKGNDWHYQYVIDPTAQRIIAEGVNPEDVEDAYSISPERRVAFQADLQDYVDMGISSTINLPAWGSEKNNESTLQDFENMMIKYLPRLRGITVYPDGARSGQPLQPIPYTEAIDHVGQVFVEYGDVCDITKGGSCNT